MSEEKSRVRKAIDSLINNTIIFLFGEEEKSGPQPLFTREEKDELGYSVRKQLERYKKHDSE